MDVDLLDLETAIKALSGVLGCVIFSGAQGEPREIQVFTRPGVHADEVRSSISQELTRRGLEPTIARVLVSELQDDASLADVASDVLSAAAMPDDEEDPVAALERRLSAAAGRPAIRRVALTSTSSGVEAEVLLEGMAPGRAGRARGEKTAGGVEVVARAALDAVHRVAGGTRFTLHDASVVSSSAGEAVLVFVGVGDQDLVGAALVRDDPMAEVVVRATLAAVNRRLGRTV